MWILKGTCHDPGHPWKDGHRRGDIVFVYSRQLPRPYAPGQYPRVGNPHYSASRDHFTFTRATWRDVLRLVPTIAADLRRRRRGKPAPLRCLRFLAITVTPFIWHWPQIDRSLELDPVIRFGPINISCP